MEKVSSPGIKLPLGQVGCAAALPLTSFLRQVLSAALQAQPWVSPAAHAQAAGHYTKWELEMGIGRETTQGGPHLTCHSLSAHWIVHPVMAKPKPLLSQK